MELATLHTIVAGVGIALLGVAAVFAVIRMSRGPSILDRVVASDVLVAIVIAGLVIEEVINRHTTTLPVILVLSLVGFAGPVSVARLVAAREAPRGHDEDDHGPNEHTDEHTGDDR